MPETFGSWEETEEDLLRREALAVFRKICQENRYGQLDQMLREKFRHSESAIIWLGRKNQFLGGETPAQAIRAGYLQEVLDALSQA